jgi:hypothetical protein
VSKRISLSHLFSRLSEAWHRRADDDLQYWLEVWLEAFELANFILDDTELAMEVAHEAIVRIDEERPKRRHQLQNSAWYQSKRNKTGTKVKLRKPLLPDHQYLDLLVYYFSTQREHEKFRRGKASCEDLDVWFVKSVFEHSYWLRNRQQGAPAFRLMLGLAGAIFNYDIYQEVPLIWEELVDATPWRNELWARGDEPFQLYWQKLLGRIRVRFDSLLQRDGPDNFIRRTQDQQPDQLVWQCLDRFKLRDSNNLCLDRVTKIGNENLTEIMRLHVVTHRECFASLVKQARLTAPENRIGLPEYKVKTQKRNVNSKRGGSDLSEDQLREVREGLHQNLYRRKTLVGAYSIVITLDDAEQHEASKELNERGATKIPIPDDVRLCQLWARSRQGRDDVLLTAFLLTHAASKPRVVLDSGDVLVIDLIPKADDGDCMLKVIHRKGALVRLLQAVLPNTAGVTPLIEYPRLSAGLLSAAFLVATLILLPAISSLIARFSPAPQPESRPALTGIAPQKDSANGTPSPGSDSSTSFPPEEIVRDNNNRYGQGPVVPSNTNRRVERLPATRLAEVRRIYVERLDLHTNTATNDLIRSAETKALDEGGSFLATPNRAHAQAILALNTDYRSSGKRFVRPRLLSKKGSVLWEGPLIELSPSEDGVLDQKQLTSLIEQLKIAVKELQQAKTREQIQP